MRQRTGKIKQLVCMLLICLLSVTAVPRDGISLIFAQADTVEEGTYSLDRKSLHLTKGKSHKLKVLGGAKNVKWWSGNKKVATVKAANKKGTVAKVYGKSAGVCTVYARVGTETYSCTVQITAAGKAKPGTYKNGAYYVGKKKVYTLERTLSSDSVDLDFTGCSYLYIGASRAGNTSAAVNDTQVFFYSYPGCGINCMFTKMLIRGTWKYPALKVIDTFLQAKPAGTVLIDLGGNDLNNVKGYIGLYRDLIRRYPSAQFYFEGVQPREDGTNKKRRQFNNKLKAAFPTRVIDLYDFVWTHPLFETVDGVHYPPYLSRIIYQETMRALGRDITVDFFTGVVMGDGITAPTAEQLAAAAAEEAAEAAEAAEINAGE